MGASLSDSRTRRLLVTSSVALFSPSLKSQESQLAQFCRRLCKLLEQRFNQVVGQLGKRIKGMIKTSGLGDEVFAAPENPENAKDPFSSPVLGTQEFAASRHSMSVVLQTPLGGKRR